jgi:hypothetical protein
LRGKSSSGLISVVQSFTPNGSENPCVASSIPVLATSVGALYVLLLFSLAGENGIPTELVISLNHPKQIFKNILEDCFGVSVPLNLR